MANRTYEEVLKFLVQAEGSAEVVSLAKEILSLGEAGAIAEGKTAALLESLGNAQGLSKTVEQFRAIGTEVAALNKQYAEQRTKVETLGKAYSETEEPTKRQTAALARARTELKDIEGDLQKSTSRWSDLREELQKAGLATTSYTGLQSQITTKQQQASAALREYAGDLLKVRTETQANTARLDDQDEAFRKQAASSRVSADALKNYRDRQAAAATGTEQLSEAAKVQTGVLSKLKTVAATVLGFLSFGTLLAGLKSIVGAGSDAEQELGQLNAVLTSTGNAAGYSAKQLVDMAEKLSKTSAFSTGDIVNAQTRLLSYTNIVGTAFPQALQIVIDQSARLGISIEQSAEIVGKALQSPADAMSALGKQGFILSDSQKAVLKQLEATGQTAQAQKIIMDLLVESYGGAAAAKKIGTMAGLWKAAKDQVNDFLQSVSQRGVLDAFKAQIAGFLQTLERLAKDGSLARWAQQTADAIVKVGTVLRNGATFILEHRGALVELGKAFAALKIAQWVVQLNALRSVWLTNAKNALYLAGAFETTATKAARVGAAIKAIPTSVKIGIALVGLDLLIAGSKKLGAVLGENSEAADQAAALSAKLREQMRLEAVQRATLAASLSEYKDQAVLTGQQVSTLGETERATYKTRLDGLKQYLTAQLGYLLRQKEIGLATQEQLDQLAELPAQLAAVRDGYKAIGEGSRLAAVAITSQLTPAAQVLVDKLKGIESDGKLAAASIKTLFEGLNFVESNTLGDVGLALGNIATQSAGADRNVREGLAATLRQLTGDELLRFQSAAAAAFGEFKKGPQESAAILESTLLVAMEKLGVSAERMGVQFTESGKDATAAFSTILENANATSAQIEVAFKAALSKVSTLEEAKTLGTLLEAAGQQGKVGFDAAERAAAALHARIGQIQTALEPLADEFARLGIKSQAELNRTRDAAKAAFDAIQQGVSKGTASVEDSRRAFVAYAQAARAAVADSDVLAKDRVEAELAVRAAVLDTTGTLKLMGDTGAKAGDAVAGGADRAATALSGTASAAADAASNTEAAGEAAETAGEKAKEGATGFDGLSFSMGAMSDEAARALVAVNKYAGFGDIWAKNINEVMGQLRQQKTALSEVNDQLDEQLQKFDPLAESLAALKAQYSFVDDATLRAIAEKQQRLKQEQQRVDDEAKRVTEQAAQAQQRAVQDTQPSGAAAASSARATGAAAATGARAVSVDDQPLVTLRVEIVDGGSVNLRVTRDSANDFVSELKRHKAVSTRSGR